MFFSVQAPLLCAEAAAGRWLRRRHPGVRVPQLLCIVVTLVVLEVGCGTGWACSSPVCRITSSTVASRTGLGTIDSTRCCSGWNFIALAATGVAERA